MTEDIMFFPNRIWYTWRWIASEHRYLPSATYALESVSQIIFRIITSGLPSPLVHSLKVALKWCEKYSV